MGTVVLSSTFNIKDCLQRPAGEESVEEREDRYNENMRWLDEDFKRAAGESMTREWNKYSVCDKEFRDSSKRKLNLLDGELWNGSPLSIRAKERWTSAIKSVKRRLHM